MGDGVAQGGKILWSKEQFRLQHLFNRGGDLAALGQSKDAQDTGELVCGLSACGAGFIVGGVAGEAFAGGVQDGQSFENGGAAGAPQLRQPRCDFGGSILAHRSCQPRVAAISWASTSGSNGLNMTLTTPRSEKRFWSAAWTFAVRRMTGMLAVSGRERSSRKVVGPSMPGIMTSSRMASG